MSVARQVRIEWVPSKLTKIVLAPCEELALLRQRRRVPVATRHQSDCDAHAQRQWHGHASRTGEHKEVLVVTRALACQPQLILCMNPRFLSFGRVSTGFELAAHR